MKKQVSPTVIVVVLVIVVAIVAYFGYSFIQELVR